MSKVFYIVLVAILLLSGCATQTDVNKAIAVSNEKRFVAFKDGMVECGEDAACKVGLSMAFAGGLGQQQFYREDSITDYMKALHPYLATGVEITKIIKTSGGTSGDAAGFLVTGNNNQFIGIGNKLSASDRSSVYTDWSSVFTQETNMYNRTNSLYNPTEPTTLSDTGVTTE